jgi:predicted MFS family arabinose efflux permease
VTSEAVYTAPAGRRRILAAVAGLGTTQIIGWGTTFSSLTIFGTTIGSDLGLSREAVFGGITIMLLASALVAPRVGRYADQRGARSVMMTGSLLVTLSMIALAFTQGVVTYLLAWVLVGVAMPMMLANTALVGLVQIVGANARQAITGLMLMSGLTGTVFLPLNAMLIGSIGWRNAYLCFALLHLLVCLPIHALILSRHAPAAPSGARSSGDRTIDGILSADKRPKAFVMLTIWSCAEGLIVWGLYMQIIDVLKGMGLTAVAAVSVWAIVGPAQASARLGELLLGGRYSILTTALLSAALSCASFFIILPFGGSVVTAAAFSICLGLGHGFYAIARNTLPLMLFGVREYGAYLGRMMLPQSVVNAVSPIVFATLIARFDPTAALWLAAAAAFSGFVSVLMLVRTCRS